jgi:hypothetical protein
MDPDDVKEEDPQDYAQLEKDSDDEEEDEPDEHLLGEAKVTLRRPVGAIVEKRAASEETTTWTVVTGVTKDTRIEWSALFHAKVVGPKGGIPMSEDVDVDLLIIVLIYLNPGNIEDDLSRLNEEGFRKRECWKRVTQHDWVGVIDIIYVAQQFNRQEKGLYGHLWRHEGGRHLTFSAS